MRSNFFDAISWLHKENFVLNDLEKGPHSFFNLENNNQKSDESSNPFDLFSSFLTEEGSEDKQNQRIQLHSHHLSPELEKVIDQLAKNIVPQFFYSYSSFTKSLKASITAEFNSYRLDSEKTSDESLTTIFDSLIIANNKTVSPLLHDFINAFSKRVACYFFLRIKFIVDLCQNIGITFQFKDIINPSLFLSQIFPKGSSRELHAPSLKSNHFSWYRPSESEVKLIEQFVYDISKIKLPLFISTIILKSSYKKSVGSLSQSLSHPSFSQLISLFIKDFPLWIKPKNDLNKHFPIAHFVHLNKKEELLNTKIAGDFVDSLSISVLELDDCLQKNQGTHGAPIYHDFIISKNDDSFYKFIFEIYFLIKIITQTNHKESLDLVAYLSKLTKSKNLTLSTMEEGQFNLFPEYESKKTQKYDRIILNLLDFPKNNPHFYLINQVMNQEEFLEDEGILLVFSAKKLFIPSQREKIEQLLKSYKLESSISFDKIKEGSNIPPFLYIFSKKNTIAQSWMPSTLITEEKNLVKKTPCLSFRLCGDSLDVEQLPAICDNFKSFFASKNPETTPIFQNELENGIIFEFFQDAILDGRLINSSSKDSSQITHPSFFKHLIKSGLPFDHFFYLENIRDEEQIKQEGASSEKDDQQIPFSYKGHYPYVLIINFRNSDYPLIEITTFESYKGKYQEYGKALCHYFGLIPKINRININHFRLFFKSQLAQQIIQLSLNGGTAKLKAKVSSILVPKFFASQELPTPDVVNRFEKISSSVEKYKNSPGPQLERTIIESLPFLNEIHSRYPWTLFSFLSHLHFLFGEFIESSKIDLDNIDFRNPLLIQKLIKLPQRPLYPNNNDYFVELCSKSIHELNSPLYNLAFVSKQNSFYQTQQTQYLELQKEDGEAVAKIHSDYQSLFFIHFLLKNGPGQAPISAILHKLKVPTSHDLNKIILDFVNDSNIYKNVLKITDDLIDKMLKQQILNLH